MGLLDTTTVVVDSIGRASFKAQMIGKDLAEANSTNENDVAICMYICLCIAVIAICISVTCIIINSKKKEINDKDKEISKLTNENKELVAKKKELNKKIETHANANKVVNYKKSLFDFCCESIKSKDVPESIKAELWSKIKDADVSTTPNLHGNAKE